MQWKELYDKAAEKLAPRAVSPFIEAGGVAAAILTAAGNVYTGVCIDTACTLGGAQRHRQYDHERGEPHCAAGVRDGGRARGNALRRVQGIHDAAG